MENAFRINFFTGYLELYVDKFFPCTLTTARKVFSLVFKYCSLPEQKRLYDMLLCCHNDLTDQKERVRMRRIIDIYKKRLHEEDER